MIESPNFCLDIRDRLDFGEGEAYQFKWVKENEFSTLELLPVNNEEDDTDTKNKIFEIYFEDLTKTAQKQYLKFMGVSDPKELNMDIPGVVPIAVIEQ